MKPFICALPPELCCLHAGIESTHLKRISRSTDAQKNADEPYEDGDQSIVPGMGFGGDAQEDLRNVWSCGGDFNPANPPGSGSADVSSFLRACYFGNVAEVTRMIKNTAAGSIQRTQLLELHESVIRMTPLLSCIAGTPLCPPSHIRVSLQASYLTSTDSSWTSWGATLKP